MNNITLKLLDLIWHSIRRTISVVCVLAVIGLIGLGIKRILYPPPTTTQIQKAETIQNIHYDYSEKEKAFLGLKIWKFRIGISIK